MKILHICNDFFGSKVHENLYNVLDENKLIQTIYCPIKKHNVSKNKSYKSNASYKVVGSETIRKSHSLFFRRKIKFLYNDLISKINLKEFDIIHATTLFSDGAIALKIFEKYNIPYVVAIRGTDVSLFLKYRRDLLPIAIKILMKASRIIFISNSLKHTFLQHSLINRHRTKLEYKCEIVYNGIDDYWLDDLKPKKITDPYKILFVGRLINRKNAVNLARAVLALNEKGIHCELNIVGEGGSEEIMIKELVQKNSGTINFLGAIKEKIQLKKIYRNNHIFGMPSIGETFGLVYIEALTQGLPVLFCKNEGIDGVFGFKVGEKCNGDDVLEISYGLEKIIQNYNKYELDAIDFSNFRWKKIAHTYLEIYSKVIHRQQVKTN